jgi:hypothetical protein
MLNELLEEGSLKGHRDIYSHSSSIIDDARISVVHYPQSEWNSIELL